MSKEIEDRQAQLQAEEQRRAERDRWSDDAIDREPVLGRRGARRLLWIGLAILVLILLVTLPPLLNVSRYQRRVASAIAGAIGRPVRFDSIELHLLPLPGFTIHNFVVMEGAAFGAEPTMRANTVEARIRFASLWRRRVEISRIRLESPTVNLVRNAAGYWNLQGVVNQAAQVQSAPTAQHTAGSAPRFPYIEATDARVDLKLGETKLPYSLTDAEFALWLPSEQEWHLRLSGRPMRTDTDASDVGQLRIEATLGRNAGNAAQQPLTLQATWKPTPLGEASKLVLGDDSGWRGSVSGEVQAEGTLAALHVTSDLHVRSLRRAEFVPAETVELDAHCEARAFGVAHGFRNVRCALPTANRGSLLDNLPFFKTSTETIAPDVLTLQADLPDVGNWRTATAKLSVAQASPLWVLQWMRLFSTRMAGAANVGGRFSLLAERDPTMGDGWRGRAVCACTLPALPSAGAAASPGTSWAIRAVHPGPLDPPIASAPELLVAAGPVASFGDSSSPGIDDAAAVTATDSTLTLTRAGATAIYPSVESVHRLAQVLPPLTDNLPESLTGPVTATRFWGKPQVWQSTAATPPVTTRHRRSRR